jgi:hypothetical protein
MASSNDSPQTTPSDLQFDHAEFAAENPAAPADVTRCAACRAGIDEVYYAVGERIVCARCRDKIEALHHGGSRFARALKGLVFGAIGAAIGAALYYAIVRVTGWNIGLVAVVVGLLVGGAVKAGSENRGGRFYQLLAVCLTYSAIVAMYAVPALLAYLHQEPDKAAAPQVVQAQGRQAAPEPGAKLEAKGADKPAPAPRAALPPQIADRPRSLAGKVVLFTIFVAILVGLIYSIPVQIAVADPISGLIFGFALWEAWKINRKVRLSFHGPFRLSAGRTDLAQREEAGLEH